MNYIPRISLFNQFKNIFEMYGISQRGRHINILRLLLIGFYIV